MNKKCSKCNTENPLHAKYCRACGKKFHDVPEIVDFRLNAVYKVGDMVDLSWDVTDADKVTLNGVVVTGKTHIPITIKSYEDYTLVAQKGKNEITKTITVHPKKTKDPSSNPTPTPSVSILRQEKWTVLLGLLSLTVLLVVCFNETIVPSYFNIGYSGWLNMKPIIITMCWIVLLFCMGSVLYSKKIK